MMVSLYIFWLLSFPEITGLDLGNSRFKQYRNALSSNSVGSFSRRDILLLDLIFFNVLFFGSLKGREELVSA